MRYSILYTKNFDELLYNADDWIEAIECTKHSCGVVIRDNATGITYEPSSFAYMKNKQENYHDEE